MASFSEDGSLGSRRDGAKTSRNDRMACTMYFEHVLLGKVTMHVLAVTFERRRIVRCHSHRPLLTPPARAQTAV